MGFVFPGVSNPDYSAYIHLSRYSRWLEDEQRRERWPETVSRYCDFWKGRFGKEFPYKKIYDAVLNFDVMPSMRCMMTAGRALERDEMAGFNCSAIPVENIRAFDEILYILMCGTGVGFSVEKKFVNKLPIVGYRVEAGEPVFVDQLEHTDYTINVADSKIGWASSFNELLKFLYSGYIPKWDLSKIRPSGAPLKTMGGRASGPDPLDALFVFACNLFSKACGRKLTCLEAHDLVCKVADIVVVGGVRRSALISLSDLSDVDMRGAKSGLWYDEPDKGIIRNGHRALANNSAVFEERPSMAQFFDEWNGLFKSGSGERGIFNREALRQKVTEGGVRDPNHTFLTNPCFRWDTYVHTREGAFQIKDLVGKTTEIWDGTQYVEINNFRVTGKDQPMLRFELHDGSEIVTTAYHTFELDDGTTKQAKDLELNDRLAISNAPVSINGVDEPGAYLKGFMLGDGTTNGTNPLLWLYEPKYGCTERLLLSAEEVPTTKIKASYMKSELRFTDTKYARKSMQGLTPRREDLMPWVTTYKYELPKEIFAWSKQSRCDFLAGLFDSDGCTLDTANGFGYQISAVSRPLLAGVQLLLKTLGVQSTLRPTKEAGKVNFGEERGGVYATQALYRLSVSQIGAIDLSKQVRFTRLASFASRKMSYQLRPRWNRIAAISNAGIDDEVYCCTVPTNHRVSLTHGVKTGQCGEIALRPYGLCNLSEIVVRANNTVEGLKRKIEIAAIIGTFQSTLTNFRYVRDIWRKNAEEERLLGVSMTGIMDNKSLGIGARSDDLRSALEELRGHAWATNKIWAKRIGINESVAITTVKPSGTVSQLVDSASGIHPRHARFYVRRAKTDAKDPLGVFMKSVGFPHEDSAYKPGVDVVFNFPMAAPKQATLKSEVSAIDQLEHYKIFRSAWCDHNPSITVSIRDHEWLEVGAWVYKNFNSVGGVSFLPYADHIYKQAPFEEIDEETYETLRKEMPKDVDWDILTEPSGEMVTGTRDLACSAGYCDIS
jgi:ribonucleotide reductase class II